MPNDMNDDDIFLVFHRPTITDRFTAIRYPWYKLKQYFIPGPKGDTGAQGPQGIAGVKGDTGTQGPKGDTGSAGPQGVQGVQGATGAKGDIGPAGTPKRVERYTETTNASGVVTVTFKPAFNSVPDADVIETWINVATNPQMVTGTITSISTTGCTAQIMVSKGTLLLTSGPFQAAPTGTSTIIRVIGN